LAIVTTAVTIKSHYDNFSGSMGNVKHADILYNTLSLQSRA